MRDGAIWAFWGRQGQSSHSFMQNKANFRKGQMNIKPIKTKDYEKRWAFTVEQKQSQTKPRRRPLAGSSKH
jgi:hypothetical protein